MPKTLLAIDDSATMRKVLEITFGGEEFRVVSAEGPAGALARLGEDPVAAVIDTSLGNDDGYALAKELRARSARLAVVLMASRYSPYDANRGRDAGVDDFIDKPFDTQSIIEKVKKAITARETAGRAVQPQAPPAANVTASFGGVSGPKPQGPPIAAGAPMPGPSGGAAKAWSTQRTHTLSFEGTPTTAPPQASAAAALSRTAPSGTPIVAPPAAPSGVGQAAAPAAPSPFAATQIAGGPTSTPIAAQPAGPQPSASFGGPRADAAAPAAAAMPTTAPRGIEPAPSPGSTSPVGTSVNGHLAGKLDDLGLTQQQAEAVLALSREVVERVVWEVVPQLAEALIREEIARLTKEA